MYLRQLPAPTTGPRQNKIEACIVRIMNGLKQWKLRRSMKKHSEKSENSPYETETDAQSPGVYLRQLPAPTTGGGLQRQSELRASSAEKAAHYLDAALAGRSLDAQVRQI